MTPGHITYRVYRLVYTINPHGGDHVASLGGGNSPVGMEQFYPLGIYTPASPDDLGPYRLNVYKVTHCLGMIKDCMVTCGFLPYGHETHVDVLRAITGLEYRLDGTA